MNKGKSFRGGRKGRTQTAVLKQTVKKVNKILSHVEKKLYDKSTAGEFASDATVYPLSDMAEGSTSKTREGLKISPSMIELRGEIVWSNTAAGCDNPVRLIVVQDRDAAGATPTIAQLLENAETVSLFNNVNLRRFKILVDKTFHNHDPHVGSYLNYTPFNFKRKMAGSIRYLGSTADASHSGKGNVYAYVIGNVTLASADNSVIDMWSRLHYVDL